ncbi:MAG: hypothetical protein V4629_12765 [Pseudomonadota bacterium]
MQTIIALLNNTWIVGIIGGVLSGLIVNYVSRYYLSKKENRESLQKIFSVNREVIYAIRPSISEGVIPKLETIEALIIATSRKYLLNREDVYGPKEIMQELIKEVMDSSFINSHQKKEYCDQLLTILFTKFSAEMIETENNTFFQKQIAPQHQRDRNAKAFSMLLGLYTGSASSMSMIMLKDSSLVPKLSETSERILVFMPVMVAITVVIMFAVILPTVNNWVKFKNIFGINKSRFVK